MQLISKHTTINVVFCKEELQCVLQLLRVYLQKLDTERPHDLPHHSEQYCEFLIQDISKILEKE